MAPFDRSHMISYYSFIVTIVVSFRGCSKCIGVSAYRPTGHYLRSSHRKSKMTSLKVVANRPLRRLTLTPTLTFCEEADLCKTRELWIKRGSKSHMRRGTSGGHVPTHCPLKSTREDQKVLQLPTLVNKMVKINGWVRISKYELVISL